MDGDSQISDAFRNAQKWSSPHWRWDRAAWIWLRRRRKRHQEDDWTLRAIQFHMPKSSRRRRLDPAILEAWTIYTQNEALRWKLEANVLAGVEPARISQKLAITREVIEVFEKLFFDVRDSFGAGGWLRAHVFTWTPSVSEFKPLRQIWAEVGFGMGAQSEQENAGPSRVWGHRAGGGETRAGV